MKPFPKQLEEAVRIIAVSPHQADSLSQERENQYLEKERLRTVRLCSARLERFLRSEEAIAIQELFKQVWERDTGFSNPWERKNWSVWRIFLYKKESRDDLVEIIWFGGNGLEIFSWDMRHKKYETVPVTPLELVTRMSLNTSNFDQAGISRPEQIIPFIRMNAMDLVRYLQR